MRFWLTCLLFIINILVISAQDTSVLTIQNDTAHIDLVSVDIDIQVIGSVASTVTTLTFYNPNDRILEGELNFPLADGQNVHRFAMDVNGKLREGVVVEKNQGRKAFEGVVRQTIDPGLLEHTVGNNYKTRIYPIPAKGYKSVLIGYEQELLGAPASYSFVADYGLTKDFNIKVEVVNQEFQPIIKENGLAKLTFDKWQNSYVANFKRKDFDVTGIFSFDIPINIREQVYRQESKDGDYFYLTVQPNIQHFQKQLPSSLAIIWDASKSSEDRDTSKELHLIKNYIQKISDVDVRLIVFSNEIHEEHNFKIVNGQSKKLLDHIKQIEFDGGTSYKCLELDKIDQEEILFFTDGISNLDVLKEISEVNTVQLVSSTKSIDNDFAKWLTRRTGGNFINLLSTELDEALTILTNLQYQFLGATFDELKFEKVYPSVPLNLQNPIFSIAGRVNTNEAEYITLNFGLGGKIIESRTINIHRKSDDINIERLWAKKKMSYLLEHSVQDRGVIIALAKQYSLVTPYTSLIVLDRVEDYVQYEIMPPADLKEEYVRLMAEKRESVSLSEEQIREMVLTEYEDVTDWWKMDKKDIKNEDINNEGRSEAENLRGTEDLNVDENNDGLNPESRAPSPPGSIPSVVDTALNNRVIQGHVYDPLGEPLIGASIHVKGSTIGTISDVDGSYEIRVGENDILVIRYTGYNSKEVPINSNFQGDVIINEAIAHLDEVVVSGLRGRAVAGVQVQHSIASSIVIRGNSSVRIGSNPLYIIDGALVDREEVNSINPDNIASLSIIKGVDATSVYGSSAINGVVVLMTKDAVEMTPLLADSILSSIDTEFAIKDWEPDEPYLDKLRNTPTKKQYEVYLSLRKEYGSTPSFYLVVGKYFISNNQKKLGFKVLSNIAELNLENHELLKILAQSYLQEDKFATSIYLFEKIAELRPDEPQSKRDLALAYQESGTNQKALDLFHEILLTDLDDSNDRFPMIKSTVLFEMNNLISSDKRLDLSEIHKDFIIDMPVDIRIVLDWNTLETDLDLWVTDPNGERCGYKNLLTSLGGRLTRDYVDGYGPEEYILKNAKEGEYNIEIDYYDERVQKVSGPVTLQVTIYTHYGTDKQKVKRLTRELKKVEDVIKIGKFIWSTEAEQK